MADTDLKKYAASCRAHAGKCPEWVELSMAELLDEQTGLLEAIEEHWTYTPPEFLYAVMRDSIRALRALIWAARRKAGCVDDPATFKPTTQVYAGVQYEELPSEAKAREEAQAALAADADPPANRAGRRAAAKKTSSRAAASKK